MANENKNDIKANICITSKFIFSPKSINWLIFLVFPVKEFCIGYALNVLVWMFLLCNFLTVEKKRNENFINISLTICWISFCYTYYVGIVNMAT